MWSGDGAVQVFAFGDQFQAFDVPDTFLPQDCLERLEILSVDDQQFMLVELDLHRLRGRNDGDARAAVVEEQLLEIVQVAQKNRQVDLLADEIIVATRATGMTRFENDIYDRCPSGSSKLDEEIEEIFPRHRGGENGNLKIAFAIHVESITFPWNNRHARTGPDRVGQEEIAVAIHSQVVGHAFSLHGLTSKKRLAIPWREL